MSNQQAKGAAVVVVSASCSATLGIFLKFAYAAGANITTIISVRFVLAALLLLLWLRLRRIPVRLPLPQVLALCAMGALGYGGMSLLFAIGLRFAPASLAGMLLYTYPAIVTLLSFLLREERMEPMKALALLVCLGGLYLVLGVTFAGIQPAGAACILSAAFIYSVYIVLGNRLLKHLDPLVAAAYICGSTGLAFTAWGLATRTLQGTLPPQGWAAILGITLLPTFLGIVCFLAGIRLVGASRASIICTLEPFITVLLSCLLLAERISPTQVLGGLLIISGVLALQLRTRA
ncbi:MAG TPA: DMT family transporter [Holophaga sp.]|nr:DMT family transporter [Holophaga sp.]HPS68151.1 DMT family transporter [Holophaga sp.]